MKNFYLLSLLTLLSIGTSFAQYQIDLTPRISPDKGVLSKVGFTDIIIEYGSPAVNDRSIWGDLIPYEKVWRAGANNATTIEFSEDVEVEGSILSAGKYALFMIPNEDEDWQIIFNQKEDQWGTFSYDENDNVLVIDATPILGEYKEHLQLEIKNIDFDNAEISMHWEYVKVHFRIKTNFLEIFERLITHKANEVAEANKWVLYLQAADYLLENNGNLAIALDWINKSETIASASQSWKEHFYPRGYVLGHLYWVKAKLLAAQENFKEADKYVQRIKKMEGDFTFYQQDGVSENIDSLSTLWKSQ